MARARAEKNGTTAPPPAQPATKTVSAQDYLAQRIRATEAEIIKLQGSLAELRHLQQVFKPQEV